MNGGTGSVAAGPARGLPDSRLIATLVRPALTGTGERRPGVERAWPLLSGLGPIGALPTAPGLARAFTTLALAGWGLDRMKDEVVLIVSELTTNVVQAAQDEAGSPAYDGHGRLPAMWLRLTADQAVLTIEVRDTLPPSAGVPAPCQAGSDAESGRGLEIVAGLSLGWGWEPVPGNQGKRTWATLPVP
jgi:hypothetical protein